MDIAIWWLDQDDYEAIGNELPDRLPQYLREQYGYRHGRPGRGRLWVDPDFGKVEVNPWPSTPIARRVEARCGGIVVKMADAAHLLQFPGLLTDDKLNRLDISIFA